MGLRGGVINQNPTPTINNSRTVANQPQNLGLSTTVAVDRRFRLTHRSATGSRFNAVDYVLGQRPSRRQMSSKTCLHLLPHRLAEDVGGAGLDEVGEVLGGAGRGEG